MITEYILKKTLKNNNYNNKYTREKVGYISGIVGVIVNTLLAILKLVIGIIISSIAVTADAFNNLADAASSIMTIVGFKLSNTPPDKNHPYGHGRVEHITTLTIAILIMFVGVQFVKSSFDRIIDPKPVEFRLLLFVFLIISIVVKVWLSSFNKYLGKKIKSNALKAVSIDSLWDSLVTLIVVLSLALSFVTDFPIDGYIGIVVAIMIFYSGFTLIKEAVSELIGEAPSEDLIEKILEGVLSYDNILGVHDLKVHQYGAGKTMATIDAEIPPDIDVVTIHNIIDQAERELGEKYDIDLVIHMDPIGLETETREKIIEEIRKELKDNYLINSIHDFNIIDKGNYKCIIFDVSLDGNKIGKNFFEEEFKNDLIDVIKNIDRDFYCKINITIDYQDIVR
ncbi:cation diffusion facilitator family transporter [Senegalia massiliensis]|uniref:Cation transporter n=1 Tax=Senegalia massiliensis TaxID=1720316 RepID=A0A845QV97_9CLOT|nr:cation diffusion facilitator family transporter [Senegalia massiliensis]NBI05934.1 cation transporter [Senegalia massiliensis]